MLEGLIVGLEMLTKFCGSRKYRKRVFLITDGEKELQYTDAELAHVTNTIKQNDIKLNCITLDFCNDLAEDESDEEAAAAPKEEATPNQQKNKEFLMAVQEDTGSAIIPAETAIEIYQQFKKKEIAARTKYRGNLDISPELKLGIQIFTKTKEETLPSLKKYNKNLPEQNGADHGKVAMEKTFTEADDPDQREVPTTEHQKAYYYGKQLVPVSEENEHVLKLQPKKEDSGKSSQMADEDIKMEQKGIEKEFKLLGFTDQSRVPRHHFMAGVDVVLPVKGSKNERAFAAMVNAMINTHKVLIAKLISRKNADPNLVCLYPHISKKQPLLYLVQVPTSENIRDYQFPSLVASTNA